MEADLKLLKKRNELLGVKAKVTWVDNCCTVSAKLEKIIPSILVKTHCFHWQKRWDPIFVDINSEKTTAFRCLQVM